MQTKAALRELEAKLELTEGVETLGMWERLVRVCVAQQEKIDKLEADNSFHNGTF